MQTKNVYQKKRIPVKIILKNLTQIKSFNETSLPDKEFFYSELYLKDITDKDYAHAQKIFEELKLKNLGDYHGLYIQSDTLLLADVFENFRDKSIEIYELEPTYLLSVTRLTWEACLKNIGVKLKLLTEYMLLMVEKGITGRMRQAIQQVC